MEFQLSDGFPKKGASPDNITHLGSIFVTIPEDGALENAVFTVSGKTSQGLAFLHQYCSGVSLSILKGATENIKIAQGSRLRIGENLPTEITSLQIRIVDGKPRIIGARNGAAIVHALQLGFSSISGLSPVEHSSEVKPTTGVYHPIIQVAPLVESGLCEVFQQYGKIFQSIAADSSKPTWPEALIKMADQYAVNYQKTRANDPHFVSKPLVPIKHTVIESELRHEEPSHFSSLILEIMQTGTVNGKVIPDKNREAIRNFLKHMSSGNTFPVRGAELTIQTKPAVINFIKLALARYEFADVEEGENFGYTDRHRSWTEILQGLSSGKPLLFEAAFERIQGRIVRDSRLNTKTGESADSNERKELDGSVSE